MSNSVIFLLFNADNFLVLMNEWGEKKYFIAASDTKRSRESSQSGAFFHSHLWDFKQRDISKTIIFFGVTYRTKDVSSSLMAYYII